MNFTHIRPLNLSEIVKTWENIFFVCIVMIDDYNIDLNTSEGAHFILMNLADQPPIPSMTLPSARSSRRPVGCMLLTFLLGIVVGVIGLLLVGFAFTADRDAGVVPAQSANGAVVVHISATYLTQIVQKNIRSSGIPGAATITNARVIINPKAPITITGDEQLGFLGARKVTITVQPSAQNCSMHMRVLHVDVGGMPITGLVAGTLEDNINQQMHLQVTGLPEGFTYCTTGVQTESGALVVIYSATPT